MSAPITRTYPVPHRVSSTTPLRVTDNPVFDRACQYAKGGRIRGYQLPVLASGPWREGAEWAQSIIDREAQSHAKRRETLLASIDYSDDYMYHGVLDSNIEDHEVIVGLIRSGEGPELEYWDGVDWGQIQFNPEDQSVDFVLLDPDLMADVVESFRLGIGGVTLSPFQPKAWVPGESESVQDFFAHLNPGPESPIEVYVDSGDEPTLVASLEQAPYEAVHRAVAKWARRVDPMCASGSRKALRSLLVREGVRVGLEDLPDLPEAIETVSVVYGGDRQDYPIGQPVVASGGVGPDIIYAIVDEMDTSAVLDLIRVAPGPIAYKRQGGKWVKDQPTLMKLLGVDPPPVIELQPDQVEEVLGQVDAYDQANPPKAEKKKQADALTAGVWEEDLHPRNAGKFAKKNGPAAAPRPRIAPRRPTPRDLRGKGNRPTAAQMTQKPWLALQLGNDKNFHDLDMGLGKAFWDKQPDGFRKWLLPFLRQQQVHQDPNWKSKVPPQFRGAVDSFAKAAGSKSEDPTGYGKHDSTDKGTSSPSHSTHSSPAGGLTGPRKNEKTHQADPKWDLPGSWSPEQQMQQALKNDHHFDIKFAQKGMGEARRREIFDRQLKGLTDRLTRAGVNGRGIAVVIERKIAKEKARRDAFERARKNEAEQERIRRMKHKGPQAVTADASHMPAKLQKYWIAGKGAAKIRWGTSGDFNRCRRALAKYLAPNQVSGACASLHRVATGQWPGKGRHH